MSRFLHTLLLRLISTFAIDNRPYITYAFALRCERESHSIVIQKERNVWKNGIYWVSDSGVEAFVEVVNQSTEVVMHGGWMPGRKRDGMYSVSFQADTKERFSGAVKMREALIDPNELKTYPLRDSESIIIESVDSISRGGPDTP